MTSNSFLEFEENLCVGPTKNNRKMMSINQYLTKMLRSSEGMVRSHVTKTDQLVPKNSQPMDVKNHDQYLKTANCKETIESIH